MAMKKPEAGVLAEKARRFTRYMLKALRDFVCVVFRGFECNLRQLLSPMRMLNRRALRHGPSGFLFFRSGQARKHVRHKMSQMDNTHTHKYIYIYI